MQFGTVKAKEVASDSDLEETCIVPCSDALAFCSTVQFLCSTHQSVADNCECACRNINYDGEGGGGGERGEDGNNEGENEDNENGKNDDDDNSEGGENISNGEGGSNGKSDNAEATATSVRTLATTTSTTTTTATTTTTTTTAEPTTTTATPKVGKCVGKGLNVLGKACQCGKDCHTCDYTVGGGKTGPGSCLKCKNSKYLLNGECVSAEECEIGGLSPAGSGSFSRTCAGSCVAKKGDCHQCTNNGSACSFCRNNSYLHAGACHKSCPDGLTGAGNGFYKRRCVNDNGNKDAACTRKGGNCHHCSSSGVECAVCYNKHYLHKGACVASCPDGYFPVGFGNFKRTCQEM